MSGSESIQVSVRPRPIKLDIGSGSVRHREGYVTLDANPDHHPDIVAFVPPIPLPDESCETVLCSHFLEHLDDPTVIKMMAEVWRVLIPGGTLEAVSPYVFSAGAWQDPSHRSWWTIEKFLYFVSHMDHLKYGYENRFSVIRLEEEERHGGYERDVHAILRKETELVPCTCPFCQPIKPRRRR